MFRSCGRIQKIGRFCVLFFGAIFVVVGYLVAYQMGSPLIEQAKASINWPTASGLVLESKVVRRRSNNSGRSTYSSKVSYQYQIEGKTFESKTVWFGGNISTSDRSMSHKIVKKYPANKKIVVHYNPEDPGIAVLEPGVFKTTYFYYLLGWIFLCVGILMTVTPLVRSRFHRVKSK